MSVKSQTTALPPAPAGGRAARPAPAGTSARRVFPLRHLASHLWMLPGAAVLLLLIVTPLAMLVYSGLTSPLRPGLSFDNYVRAVTDNVYVRLYVKSLWLALKVTALAIAIGWPAGWALAKVVSPKRRTLLLSLAIIPFLTSQLMLIYAMLVLVADSGPLIGLLRGLHLIGDDTSLLYTPQATLMMLAYESLPMVLLVMYSAADRIDDRLLEAAAGLGAARLSVFFRIILPLSSPSLVACFMLAFIPAAGSFVEAQILGGPNGLLIGNIISDQVSGSGNAPLGAALALVLLAVNAIVVGLVALPASGLRDRLGRRRSAREAAASGGPVSISDPVSVSEPESVRMES